MACESSAGAGGVVVTPRWGRGSPSSPSSLGRRVGQVPLLEWRVPGLSKRGGSWAGSHGIFHHWVNNMDFLGGYMRESLVSLAWGVDQRQRGAQGGGRSLGQPWVSEAEPQCSVHGAVLLVFVVASRETGLVALQVTGSSPPGPASLCSLGSGVIPIPRLSGASLAGIASPHPAGIPAISGSHGRRCPGALLMNQNRG